MATAEDLAETERLVKETGGRIVARPVDVRDFDALKGAVRDGVEELGRLDIVVANAGIGTFGTAEELTEREWRDVIDVDLIGVWLTCKATIPVIADKGNFVLTSSTMGLSAVGNATHYVAAKHGIVGLMRSLAQELAPRGIRVNSVHPTQVAGEMIFNQGMYDLFRPDLESPTQQDMAEVSAQTDASRGPLDRVARCLERSTFSGLRRSALHHRRGAPDRRRLPSSCLIEAEPRRPTPHMPSAPGDGHHAVAAGERRRRRGREDREEDRDEQQSWHGP